MNPHDEKRLAQLEKGARRENRATWTLIVGAAILFIAVPVARWIFERISSI